MKKFFFYCLFIFLLPVAVASSDTVTVYSESSDGLISLSSDTWSVLREAATGSKVTSTSTYCGATDFGMAAYLFSYNYLMSRSWFRFSKASVQGSITSVSLYLYPYNGTSTSNGTISAQQGNQGASLATDDFDAFSGDSWGTASFPEANDAYVELVFNATGIAAADAANEYIDVCVRDYTKDYSNIAPTAPNPAMGMYFSEYTGTDRDPKLIITYSPPPIISGTLKEKESDATGSAMEYLILNRSTGAVFAFGSAATDGTYSVEAADGTTEYDIFMLDPLGVYAPKTIGEMVTGVMQ